MQHLHHSTRRHRFASALAAALLLGAPLAALADRASEVATLETRCDQEREAKIKPLRDMEIAKCLKERNSEDYCRTFWKDYGNAVHNGTGGLTPRMFGDLPVCIKAFEARREFELNGR